MRMSTLFGQTLREAPADADIASHRLLLRAGFIRQLSAGVYSYLPLAQRSLTKLENIMREEINAIGGQEITMPVVHPADLWKESGRWYRVGSELGRFKDKNDRDMVLAMTHEEVVASLVRSEVHSYRDLPRLVYHIQTKWRDDPRPRGGLVRVREFTMKDSYSLDVDWEGLDRQYRNHYQAYFNIFNRCALPTVAVESDVGMMGGKLAHEFMYLTPVGEDTILTCDECGYMANRQIARFEKTPLPDETLMPTEKVATPEMKTIRALAEYLEVPEKKTAKAVFLMASYPNEDEEKFVFAVLRGDMDLNETKLSNALKARSLRPATDAEIRGVGAVPGYASPVGLEDAIVVVDDLVPESPNLVAGANEEGYHLLNVNYGRDFSAEIVTDIAVAEAGHPCPRCGSALHTSRGIEVGNIFKLGTEFSEPGGAKFLDQNGEERPVIMGSYGIGSGRLLASVAEEHHDEHGLMWPITVTPYEVHLVVLRGGEVEADDLYRLLQAQGVEVLYDDRDESPGVKFNDADLIGVPLRITVSERSLTRGGVELKRRSEDDRVIVAMERILERVESEIADLHASIAERVVEVRFDESDLEQVA